MSSFLNVKNRVPFVRRPSNESLLESGSAQPSVAMQPLPSRPASVASDRSDLRPLSLSSYSAQPLQHPEADTADTRGRVRRVFEDGCLVAAGHAGTFYRATGSFLADYGTPIAMGGLTIWCIALTVYVAKSRSEIAALNDMPFCDELGLFPHPEFRIS